MQLLARKDILREDEDRETLRILLEPNFLAPLSHLLTMLTFKYPNIPGMKDFKGKLMHSATWDPKVDLKGKTVAVIGGGSSAVQIIPQIQPGKSRLAHETGAPTAESCNIVVGKLIPFLRSSAWITTGFGAKFAGPGGTNFDCKHILYSFTVVASLRLYRPRGTQTRVCE